MKPMVVHAVVAEVRSLAEVLRETGQHEVV